MTRTPNIRCGSRKQPINQYRQIHYRRSNHDKFKKWVPDHRLDAVYDIDDVIWGHDGITFVLIPDNLDHSLRSAHKVLVTWEDPLSYQIAKESIREDCWISAQQEAWPFYESDCSERLRTQKETNVLFPEDAKHFLLVGTNLIADIFATDHPKIKIVPT